MFIDIHGHTYKYPYPDVNGRFLFSNPAQLTEIYNDLGIEKAVLLPLVGPEVYLPQSNDEILEIYEEYKGIFIPFCNFDPRALTNSPDAPFGYILSYYKEKGCRGVGEFIPNLPWFHPLIQNFLKHVEKVKFLLIFEMAGSIGGDYRVYDEPGFFQFEDCLKNFPDLIFIGYGTVFWSEISVLKIPSDRITYPSYPVEKEGRVSQLCRKYPNLYGDLSAKSGFNAISRDPEYGVKFLNEFQDKLFFGTDICYPNTPVPLVDLLMKWKREKKISEKVFNKIAKENLIKLLNLEE